MIQRNRPMSWMLIIFAVNFHVHVVIEAYTSDVTLVRTTPEYDDQKNFDTSVSSVRDSTVFDDVKCTKTDDVAAARKLLCPAHCRCSPLAGQEVLTQLTVSCSGNKFNDSTSTRLKQDIDQLLSRCVSSLTELNITNTLLTTVPQQICQLTKLTYLALAGNRLASLPSNCFTHMVNLTAFDARYNKLTSLQEGVFINLHLLISLNLRSNLISFIEPRVFDESANLSSLSYIDISHNHITELEPWPLIRAQHLNMHVNLENNRIRNFTNTLHWSFDCNVSIPSKSYIRLIGNAIEHLIDIIHGWNIDGLTDVKCFLHWLDMPFAVGIDIKGNNYKCDCMDYDVISTVRRSYALNRIYCNRTTPFDRTILQQRVMSIRPDHLICEVTELCPPNCSCIKRPYNYSFEVSCPPATLHNLPYRLPDPNKPPPRHGRFDLQFSGSSMKILDSRDYFVDSYRLDVSNSQIETVTDDAWRSLQKVDRVDLSGNRLTALPRLLQLENITFRWIALHSNPLNCDCEQRWLPAWLKTLGNASHLSNSVSCHSPDWLSGRRIVSLESDDFCRNPDRERLFYVLKIVLPTLAGVILLVITGFLIYRYRVKVFAKFKVHPFDVDECRNEDMAFDAFICCAWPEDNLARDIIERLEHGNAEEGERGGYRVCYHTRDFPLGGMILRSIEQSIEQSKRVICLLSEAFLNSEFCMLEFRMAWQWNVDHRRHRLIVVKCPGFDEALAAAEQDAVAGMDDVRRFLSTYTYIEHGSEDWWHKLLYAMPINRLPAADEDFHLQFFAGAEDNDEEPLLNV